MEMPLTHIELWIRRQRTRISKKTWVWYLWCSSSRVSLLSFGECVQNNTVRHCFKPYFHHKSIHKIRVHLFEGWKGETVGTESNILCISRLLMLLGKTRTFHTCDCVRPCLHSLCEERGTAQLQGASPHNLTVTLSKYNRGGMMHLRTLL